jgi:hypothetical protein
MDPLRLDVVPRGKGYVAESRIPAITALGNSPEEAAENARLMAVAHFAKDPRPITMIVRISQPGLHTIVMQPVLETFSLDTSAVKPDWRYMATVTNDGTTRATGSE